MRLAEAEEDDTQRARRRKLALGVLARANARGAVGTAATGEIRQRLKRRARTAEVVDEGAERARPRYYGANATSRETPGISGINRKPEVRAMTERVERG